jgi:hypothetical protein
MISGELGKYDKPYTRDQWDWKNSGKTALQYYNKIAVGGGLSMEELSLRKLRI